VFDRHLANCLKTHIQYCNLAGEQVYAYKNVTYIMNTLAICSPVSLYLMVNKKTVDWSCCVVCLRWTRHGSTLACVCFSCAQLWCVPSQVLQLNPSALHVLWHGRQQHHSYHSQWVTFPHQSHITLWKDHIVSDYNQFSICMYGYVPRCFTFLRWSLWLLKSKVTVLVFF